MVLVPASVAVSGAVLGGLAGNQIGIGSGQAIATAAGAGIGMVFLGKLGRAGAGPPPSCGRLLPSRAASAGRQGVTAPVGLGRVVGPAGAPCYGRGGEVGGGTHPVWAA